MTHLGHRCPDFFSQDATQLSRQLSSPAGKAHTCIYRKARTQGLHIVCCICKG